MKHLRLGIAGLIGTTLLFAQSNPSSNEPSGRALVGRHYVEAYRMNRVNETSTPGNIRLLPGYVNTYVKPVDSATAGRIWKANGLVVSYDIGLDAGHYETDPQWTKPAVWQTEQIVGGKRVVCIYTSSKTLLISFPDDLANFYAKVRNQRDTTDMMLMVLTYRSR
jgi:hypothetical protein